MKTLKTAVVGLGRIGWGTHIPKILQHPGQFSLVAVVDVSPERLAEAKEKYGVNGYADIPSMVAAEKPDLLVIASPTHLHRAHACAAMEAGCDVFLDKPMAESYESACAIAKCAEETGRKLMIFQPVRAHTDTNQLMELIASGKIGPLKSIRFTRMGYSRRSDWQSFKKYGGGMLTNYGAHHIDQLLYMSGEKISKLFCTTDVVATMGDADDVARIFMQTESGVRLDVDINQAAALVDTEWSIYGQYGAIRSQKSADGKPQFRMRYFDPTTVPAPEASESLAAADRKYNHDVPLPWVEEVIDLDSNYSIDFYQKVYEYFGEDKAPFVPVEETLYLMELIHRCHEIADN